MNLSTKSALQWALLLFAVLASLHFLVFHTYQAQIPVFLPAAIILQKPTGASPPVAVQARAPRVRSLLPPPDTSLYSSFDGGIRGSIEYFSQYSSFYYPYLTFNAAFRPAQGNSPAIPAFQPGPAPPPHQSKYTCCHENPECYEPILAYGEFSLQREKDLILSGKWNFSQLNYYFHSDDHEDLLDQKGSCGSGIIDINHDKDGDYYYNGHLGTNLARSLPNDNRYCVGSDIQKAVLERAEAQAEETVNFHVYWSGENVHPHVAYALKSILGSQDFSQSKIIVWGEENSLQALRNSPVIKLKNILPGEELDASLAESTVEALEFVEFRILSFPEEIRRTGNTALINAMSSVGSFQDGLHWIDSDLFRLLILHNYGGVYVDLDVLLLRDFSPILGIEWFYKWGTDCRYINGAIARMFKGSKNSRLMLDKLANTPKADNSLDWGREVYSWVYKEQTASGDPNRFTILPAAFFNPGWVGPDKKFSTVTYPSQSVGPFAFHLHGQVWKLIESEQSQINSDYRSIREKIDIQFKKRWNRKYFTMKEKKP